MAEHVSECQAGAAGQRQTPVAERVAHALRDRVPERYFMIEKYGPDGEILEASEGHPIAPGEPGVHTLIITCYGFAEPRTDWRERGVVPSRGFHRSLWRD